MKTKKQQLRQEVKAAVRLLTKETCRQMDEKIVQQVLSFSEYEKAQTIFCFVGTSSEIDTSLILEHILKSGKRLGVPKCMGKGIMEVFEIHSLHELEEGSYGILEPKEGSPVISPEEIDLALIPCLSCNANGCRLGYGGGFYDRYLVRTNAVKAVLCRESLMREEIPVDHYDVFMNYVITEKGITSVEQ